MEHQPPLTLQRASAGSGKTYTLTRTYIRFLISTMPEGQGTTRLRNPPEIADAPSRILAITFTNKATSEMKQRIVSALAALADWKPGEPKPDYLDDFAKEFHVEPQRIADLCGKALYALLNDYADFKVSTIDSFFQTILRTFAYETHLNDNYALELDAEYINREAVGTVLDDIDSSGLTGAGAFWLEVLMKEADWKWNVFNGNPAKYSVLKNVLDALKELEREEFKEIRDELDLYFNGDSKGHRPHDLRELYLALQDHFEKPLEERTAALVAAATAFRKALGDEWDEVAPKLQASLPSRISKSMDGNHSWKCSNPQKAGLVGSKVPKGEKADLEARYMDVLRKFYKAKEEYDEIAKSPGNALWDLYKPLIPMLGLIQESRAYIADFMGSSNTIQLSETNSILQTVIGKDDAPFVYERIGGRLDHMLVDEFQDTSRLQWSNLEPLLAQPLSRGQESLLIGDAKQSIYRFRNADPSIISQSVPSTFPHVSRGDSREENTNYRSDSRIVRFNNFLFKELSARLGNDLPELYSNTVQALPKPKDGVGKPERGLVQVISIPTEEQYSKEEQSGDDEFTHPYYRMFGPMVSQLLERGHRQRDIAFLVRTKAQGNNIIASLIAYNQTLPPDAPQIDFISEESLTVGSSAAVGTVVNCLTTLATGSSAPDADEKGHTHWHKVRADLAFFISSHPGLDPADQIEEFLSSTENRDVLGKKVAEMQTTVLPALVETLIKAFVPEGARMMEAPYLAAFQDLVLDWCSNFSADIASFLEWWELKGREKSISAPEDAEGVTVMTVHKAKGLEFPVVIIPEMDWKIDYTTQQSWKWVRPAIAPEDLPAGAELPPRLPVKLESKLKGTPHENDYLREKQSLAMDNLNATYVAFTRPVSELYVVVKQPKPNSKASMAKTMMAALKEAEPTLETWRREDGDGGTGLPFPEPGEMQFFEAEAGFPEDVWPFRQVGPEEGKQLDGDGHETNEAESESDSAEGPGSGRPKAVIPASILNYGHPLSETEIADRIASGERKKNRSQVIGSEISDYRVNDSLPFLKYQESGNATRLRRPRSEEETLAASQDPELERELLDEEDPRSRGTLLHDTMQLIETESDLPAALRRMRIAGRMNRREAEGLRPLLESALEFARRFGWFSRDWKVMNERPILQRGKPMNRPDRVMVSANTKGAAHPDAVVVDYKFGEKALKLDSMGQLVPRNASNLKQVRDYVASLRRSGHYGNVKGYLWYVLFDHVVEV